MDHWGITLRAITCIFIIYYFYLYTCLVCNQLEQTQKHQKQTGRDGAFCGCNSCLQQDSGRKSWNPVHAMLWSFELAGWPIRGISLKPRPTLCMASPRIIHKSAWEYTLEAGLIFFPKTLINAQNLAILGGGFRWGNDPIWRAYFSDAVAQPPTKIGILTIWWKVVWNPPRQILSAILLVPWQIFLSNGWGSGLFSTSAGRRRFTGSVHGFCKRIPHRIHVWNIYLHLP